VTGHDYRVLGVAFSPDGRTVASGIADAQVVLWNVAAGQLAGTPLAVGNSWVYSVAFSPDGKTLASGSGDSRVRLWNPATGQTLRHAELTAASASPGSGDRQRWRCYRTWSTRRCLAGC
jgi:WD40 repeat protein